VPHRLNIAPIVELPFGTGKKWAQGRVADSIIGGWIASATMSFQSGFPINIQQAADSRLGGQNTNRPNLSGAALGTAGDHYDRLASADHPTATWIDPAAFTLAPAGTFGNAPRTITALRTPSQSNVDASFIKNIRLAGKKAAQLKIEIINVLNRPNVRTLQGQNTFGNANFGRTSLQAGFMRQLQFMFRFNF
jgi:trimeric autotransporter adhesin